MVWLLLVTLAVSVLCLWVFCLQVSPSALWKGEIDLETSWQRMDCSATSAAAPTSLSSVDVMSKGLIGIERYQTPSLSCCELFIIHSNQLWLTTRWGDVYGQQADCSPGPGCWPSRPPASASGTPSSGPPSLASGGERWASRLLGSGKTVGHSEFLEIPDHPLARGST